MLLLLFHHAVFLLKVKENAVTTGKRDGRPRWPSAPGLECNLSEKNDGLGEINRIKKPNVFGIADLIQIRGKSDAL